MRHSPEPWKINEHVPGDPYGTCEIMASDGQELILAFIGNSYGEQVAVGFMENRRRSRGASRRHMRRLTSDAAIGKPTPYSQRSASALPNSRSACPDRR
jgi:hypothetical protein